MGQSRLKGVAACACALVASCGGPQAQDHPDEVVYGKSEPLKGKAWWGIEDVSIILCPGPRSDCRVPPPGDRERDCALLFSEAAFASFQRLKFDRDNTGAPVGEVWIEGVGRRAHGDSAYGHMGAHACEVRFDEVTMVEHGPPWFNEPPPAAD